MRLVSRMLLKNVFTIFVISLVFFIVIIQVIDLFANLTRYINQDVPFFQVLMVQIYFLPQSISFALPIALLFAISFTMGTLYSNNELVAILGAGIPLYRLVSPILLLGIILSFFSLQFEDSIVIPATRQKNQQSRELLGISQSFSNADITLIGAQGRVVYFADYYNDAARTLTNVLIIIRHENGDFDKRIEGRTARWNGHSWSIPDATIFSFDRNEFLEKQQNSAFTSELLDTSPGSFRRQVQNFDDLTRSESAELVQNLQQSGLPYRAALTQYYERYAFSMTPFIVTLISCAIGGKLKKNILLMSLLISLIISVTYYVIQMVLSLLASFGGLDPFIGAFSGVSLFFGIGIILLLNAKT